MTTALYAHVDLAPSAGVISTVVEPALTLDDDGLEAFSSEIREKLIKIPDGISAGPGWTVNGQSWTPPSPNQSIASLISYAELRQEQIRDGGVTINIGTKDAPISVSCNTDAIGRGLTTGNVVLAQLDSSLTFPWVQSSGTVMLTAGQMISVGVGVANFIQETYSALSAVTQQIQAGTIKTFTDVDAATWPSNS